MIKSGDLPLVFSAPTNQQLCTTNAVPPPKAGRSSNKILTCPLPDTLTSREVKYLLSEAAKAYYKAK
jgi:hypothetical protein